MARPDQKLQIKNMKIILESNNRRERLGENYQHSGVATIDRVVELSKVQTHCVQLVEFSAVGYFRNRCNAYFKLVR